MEKKHWEKPRLVVLFRGRPEEAVLETCKSLTIVGPDTDFCNTGGGQYGYATCIDVSDS